MHFLRIKLKHYTHKQQQICLTFSFVICTAKRKLTREVISLVSYTDRPIFVGLLLFTLKTMWWVHAYIHDFNFFTRLKTRLRFEVHTPGRFKRRYNYSIYLYLLNLYLYVRVLLWSYNYRYDMRILKRALKSKMFSVVSQIQRLRVIKI